MNHWEQGEKPLALCMMPRNFRKMTYIMGFSIPILEFLKEKYELVLISGEEGENEDLYKYGQVWGIDQPYLKKLKIERFKRADEVSEDDKIGSTTTLSSSMNSV